ncbi:hypothetical protein DZF91_21605 [Actinomadura logoneensis]|uniref:DUF2231 domain-containing protein n=1 Tax=Actinomadura logoneensis TaxID=2293572 RepID=A0A372JHV2_9ACTN|nr:DUF2231 domain-containing protein [Actinomadura logoneensis]RFU39583.1 hypothetical protein DZF91_21605 [Actinomadura logoneensis]
MPTTLWGLPVHPLVVHLVVFLIPLVVLAALVVAVWPRARKVAAPWVLGLATLGVVSVPMATSSGEGLEKKVPHTALVEHHAELADGLLPLVAGLWLTLAVIVAVAWYSRRAAAAPRWAAAVTVVAAVLTVGASVGTAVQVVRIGHSGAKAVWHDVGTERATGR